MGGNRTLTKALIFSTAALLGLGAEAQEKPVRTQKTLQHEVTVTLKLVQVIVTDKEGNPVTDLRKEDFILFDNGREQVLTEFEKHDIKLSLLGV